MSGSSGARAAVDRLGSVVVVQGSVAREDKGEGE